MAGIEVKGTTLEVLGLFNDFEINSKIDFQIRITNKVGLIHPEAHLIIPIRVISFQHEVFVGKQFEIVLAGVTYLFRVNKFKTEADKYNIWASSYSDPFVNKRTQKWYEDINSVEILEDPEFELSVFTDYIPQHGEKPTSKDKQNWLCPDVPDKQFLSDVVLHSYVEGEKNGIKDFMITYIDLERYIRYGNYLKVMYAPEIPDDPIEMGHEEGMMRYTHLETETIPYKIENQINRHMGVLTYYGDKDKNSNKHTDELPVAHMLDAGNTHSEDETYFGAPTINMKGYSALYKQVHSFSINRLWKNKLIPIFNRIKVLTTIGGETQGGVKDRTFLVIFWQLDITNTSIDTTIHMSRIEES